MNLVLLSGGSGQRLWPLSNDIRSKQFIKFFHREDGELESMVQRVYRQIKAVDTDATVTIATSKSQVSAIHNQLGEEVGISVDPCRRCIRLSCLSLLIHQQCHAPQRAFRQYKLSFISFLVGQK